MNNKRVLTFRFSDEQIQWLDERAQQAQVTRTQVMRLLVVEAMQQRLGVTMAAS